MAKVKFNSSTVAQPVAPAAAAPPAKASSSLLTTIAVLGWFGTVVGVGLVAYTLYHKSARIAGVKASLSAGVDKIQVEVDVKQKELNDRKVFLADDINRHEEQRIKLGLGIQVVKKEIEGLQSDVEVLEREVKKLQVDVDARREDLEISRKGVADLRQQVNDVINFKENLKIDYIDRYNALRARFEEAMGRIESIYLSSIYTNYKHSPFAPAAAYFAGEKNYAMGNGEVGAKYYKYIIKRFKKSHYFEPARERLVDVKNAVPYEPNDVGFEPFRPLNIVR